MSNYAIKRLGQQIKTFGNPFHGLNDGGILTLSNGQTVVKAFDTSQKRIGDCYAIQVPGNTYTDEQPFGTHLKFENYALSSGLFKKYLYNYKIEYGGELSWIFCDNNGDRWKMSIASSCGGTYTAPTLVVTANKFGDFYNPHVSYTKTCSFGQFAVSAAAFIKFATTIVNVNKTGSIVVIGLQTRDDQSKSGSTVPFDETYAYPSAYLRLDVTDASNPSIAVYKTSSEASKNTSSTKYYDSIPGYADNTMHSYRVKFYALQKTYHVIENNTAITCKDDISVEYSQHVYQSLTLKETVKNLPALPASEFEFRLNNIDYYATYEYSALIDSTYGFIYGKFGAYQDIKYERIIHILINDNNELLDVICVNDVDSQNSFTSGTLPVMSANRKYKNGVLLDGIITIYYETVTQNNGKGSDFKLQIGANVCAGSILVDAAAGRNKTIYNGSYLYLSGSTSPRLLDTVTYETSTTKAYFDGEEVTAFRNDIYNIFLGHMFQGHYNYKYPFVAVFTNNLVGFCYGDDSCGHRNTTPFTWNTSTTGYVDIKALVDNNGNNVFSGVVPYDQRYCSFEPVKKTFSGLKTYPVCYV